MSTPDYFQHKREEMLGFLPERYSRVLEVGCGAGAFAARLDSGAEVWGIEPDPQAAEFASSNLDRVIIGTYEQAAERLPDCYFDLLICNDVIEHMRDHDHFLRVVQRHLVPGATLVISVPNIRYVRVLGEILFRRDFRYRNEGVLDRTHLRMFTAVSLRRSLIEAGLQIERLAGINPMRINRISLTRLTLIFAIVLSFGWFADIRFLQIAARARTANPELPRYPS